MGGEQAGAVVVDSDGPCTCLGRCLRLLPFARQGRASCCLCLCGSSLAWPAVLTPAPLLTPASLLSLANLGAKADQERWGVEPFEERRDTHLFSRR